MANHNIHPAAKANDLLARIKQANSDFEVKTDKIASMFDEEEKIFEKQEIELQKIDKSIADDIDTAVLEMISKSE